MAFLKSYVYRSTITIQYKNFIIGIKLLASENFIKFGHKPARLGYLSIGSFSIEIENWMADATILKVHKVEL